ncbi:hypothetical protein BDR22DRAFT_860779 [Usnea florida]
MARPRAWAAAFLLLFFYGFSIFAATLRLNTPNSSKTTFSNAASLLSLKVPSNGNEVDGCFNPATQYGRLYHPVEQDCLNAAKELFDAGDPFKPTRFARRSYAGFSLPKVVQNGTCVILIDVMDDDVEDHFEPWLVYSTALDLSRRCTQGELRFGGRLATGKSKVVDVLVFGRVSPLQKGVLEQTASTSAVVVAREQIATSVLNETSLELTKPSEGTTSSPNKSLNMTSPGTLLECNDPPLPRERAWPISFPDCEMAAAEIFADRDRNQRYIFSRKAVATNLYFPLPATFRNKSCVVRLDMNNDSDQDIVRLSIVEATAWVLAHKCSGEEKSVDQYGGWGTVGVGTQGFIKVWVYGRPWPPPLDATNVTNLVLAQPARLIDSD